MEHACTQAKHAAQFIHEGYYNNKDSYSIKIIIEHGQQLSYLRFQALESKVKVSDCLLFSCMEITLNFLLLRSSMLIN